MASVVFLNLSNVLLLLARSTAVNLTLITLVRPIHVRVISVASEQISFAFELLALNTRVSVAVVAVAAIMATAEKTKSTQAVLRLLVGKTVALTPTLGLLRFALQIAVKVVAAKLDTNVVMMERAHALVMSLDVPFHPRKDFCWLL